MSENKQVNKVDEVTKKPRKTLENPLRKLNTKQAKYVQGIVGGKSKRQSALDAGYSPACADNAADAIEGDNVRAAFQKLMRQAIPPSRLVERVAEGLDAHRSWTDKEGESHFDTDYRERREYVKMAAQFGGYYVDKQEVDFGAKPGGGERLAELLARAANRVSPVSDPGGKS